MPRAGPSAAADAPAPGSPGVAASAVPLEAQLSPQLALELSLAPETESLLSAASDEGTNNVVNGVEAAAPSSGGAPFAAAGAAADSPRRSARFLCRPCDCLVRLRRRVRQSLSLAPTTPCAMTLLVPLLCLLGHYLFYRGQTDDMWRLALQADVDVWYNATGYEARTAFYSLGLDRETHVQVHRNETVKSFTYSYAIAELWRADGIPTKLVPRIAAGLLVLFSGLWPHVKLLALLLTWLLARDPGRRRRTLHWLAALGKWSLADVLVVCVMVGVLDLDWTVDPAAVKDGFVQQVPLLITVLQELYTVDDICSFLLHINCTAPPSAWGSAKCYSCRDFVGLEFAHPATARTSFAGIAKGVRQSGGGAARLRVEGLPGIYHFCVAVVLSILLSLLVDVLDVRAHRHRERQLLRRRRLLGGGRGGATDALGYRRLAARGSRDYEETEDDIEEQQPLALSSNVDDDADDELDADAALDYAAFRRASAPSDGEWLTLATLAVLATIAVLWGCFAPALDRRVIGAIPQLMHDVLGIAWDRGFSLQSLVGVTGAAGGWDNLLMATFALFVVVGPILRAVLCLVGLLFSDTEAVRRWRLFTAIEFIGAFCAWEVLALACYLVSLLMPMATSTIINQPECAKVDSSGTCLEVFFELQANFAVVIVGGLLLVAVAYGCNLIWPHR